jgi:hypothetical protein
MGASINDKVSFANNYANSLLLFIPDICNELRDHGLIIEIQYLKSYLKHFFTNFHRFTNRSKNSEVITIFYKNKVISFLVYFKILFNYYLFLFLNKISKKVIKFQCLLFFYDYP